MTATTTETETHAFVLTSSMRMAMQELYSAMSIKPEKHGLMKETQSMLWDMQSSLTEFSLQKQENSRTFTQVLTDRKDTVLQI